jgi:hypothetical protein
MTISEARGASSAPAPGSARPRLRGGFRERLALHTHCQMRGLKRNLLLSYKLLPNSLRWMTV